MPFRFYQLGEKAFTAKGHKIAGWLWQSGNVIPKAPVLCFHFRFVITGNCNLCISSFFDLSLRDNSDALPEKFPDDSEDFPVDLVAGDSGFKVDVDDGLDLIKYSRCGEHEI